MSQLLIKNSWLFREHFLIVVPTFFAQITNVPMRMKYIVTFSKGICNLKELEDITSTQYKNNEYTITRVASYISMAGVRTMKSIKV